MKNKIVELFVCMLLLAPAVFTAGIANWTEIKKLTILDGAVHVLSAELSDGGA